MGTFTVLVEASSIDHASSERCEALVDNGATYTTLPTSVLRRLGVSPHTQRRFSLANGVRVTRDIGRAWVRVDGKEELTLVVFGDEGAQPLLGAVTLEEMGLGVDPIARKLVPVDGYLAGFGS